MTKKALISALAALFALSLFTVGCSDDKTSDAGASTDGSATTGDAATPGAG
ncbi:MAG: hypothetical protein GMKNLPBB_02209 [Myxococcota bacterium]|nr:hypothetical protein [Myxococcota bacterium]